MGINRLVLSMQNGSNYVPEDKSPALYIATMGDAAALEAVKICAVLRERGLRAETDIVGRSLKAQMKYANKISAKYVLILGDNEIAERKAQIRNMSDSSQTEITVSADEIYTALV